MKNRDLEAEAYEAWEIHAFTEQFESAHWYEECKWEWIEERVEELKEQMVVDRWTALMSVGE
jgi:hypothetical protein